jgi:hypothetical protein
MDISDYIVESLKEMLAIKEAVQGIICPKCQKKRTKLFIVNGEEMCIKCYADIFQFP